jgi:hypothetical protein
LLHSIFWTNDCLFSVFCKKYFLINAPMAAKCYFVSFKQVREVQLLKIILACGY